MQSSVGNSSIQSSATASKTKLHSGSRRPYSLRWRSLSLRVKGILLAIAISTIPVVVVGSITYVALKESNRQSVEKNEQRLAREVQTTINQYMWERFGDIQIMASLDILTDPRLREIATAAEKSAVLEQFLKAYPIYDSVAAFDIKGEPIAQTKGERLPNFSNRSYIKEALRTKGPVLSQPITSAVNGTVNIFSAAPLKDKNTGEIIGTIRARIPVARFGDLLKGLKAQEDAAFYLMNGSGKVFYGPEGVYASQVDTIGSKISNSNKGPREKGIEDIFPEIESFKASQKAGSVLSINPTTKMEQLITYIPPTTLKGLPNLNWSVALAVDSEAAFAAQQEQLRILLMGLGLTLVLVITVSIYLINRAIRPVFESTEVVEKIGQGHLDVRVAVKGKDELAMLGTNINQMADQLQILLTTLHQNEERLKEQNDVLSELARDEALLQGNVKAAVSSFTEAIAKTLKVERASVWLFNADHSQLTCLDRYSLESQQHTEGIILNASDLPKYFQTLQDNPFLAVEDVSSHAAIQELLAAEAIPSMTTAFLSVPIRIAERTVGLIQCKRVNSHVWQADEQTFVNGVASLVAIVLESEFLQQEVSHLLDVVSDVEEGNLTINAQVSDRATGLVADTFNRLIERLAQVLTQVLDAAHQVSNAANQQKVLADTVAVNAKQQAQTVNQVLSLTEQVEQAAQGSAERVKESSESLQTVASTVMQGQTAIDALTQGITVLQEGTDRIMQRMKTLGEFVGLADQFVQNQSQIAFVTQTLSLNASLVAARASEQRDPRQFVVVAREFDSIADQVNKLAQQTSEGLTNLEQRSAQIHMAVSTVDADVQRLGELVRQFTTGVEQSQYVFNQVQGITGEAIESGESVNQFSQKIVAAAQTTAVVMREIAELANKTVELTQRAVGRSDHMDALATQLLQTVQFFQLPPAPEITQIQLVNPEPSAIADRTVTVSAETIPSSND